MKKKYPELAKLQPGSRVHVSVQERAGYSGFCLRARPYAGSPFVAFIGSQKKGVLSVRDLVAVVLEYGICLVPLAGNRLGENERALHGDELRTLATAWLKEFQKAGGEYWFELRSGRLGGVMVPDGGMLAQRKDTARK